MKKYFPIVLSKKGEIAALKSLAQPVKDNICPIIQVLRDSIEKKVEDKKSKTFKIVPQEKFLQFLKTHWSFFNNSIILDFSCFDNIDNKMTDIENILDDLIKAGVNIIPSVQANSSSRYKEMVKRLIIKNRISICIRSSEETGGIDNMKSNTDTLCSEFKLEFSKYTILFDIGYLKGDSLNTISTLIKTVIKSLNKKVSDYGNVIIAAGSFPTDLTKFKTHLNPNLQERHEWVVYKNIISDKALLDVKYGDYGTRHPFNSDSKFAGTVSIRYTIEESFVVYKGKKSGDHEDGHRQYITHAKDLVSNRKYYYGKDFSWGDERIYEIANQAVEKETSKTGNPTTWVQISQNHHITLLESLL